MGVLQKIELGGAERELLFSTAALDAVITKYGSLRDFYEQLQAAGEGAFSMLAWIITLMANQKIALDNWENGTKEPYLSSEYVAVKLSPGAILRHRDVILQAMADGMSFDAQEDREVDVGLEEIRAQKNAVTGEA